MAISDLDNLTQWLSLFSGNKREKIHYRVNVETPSTYLNPSIFENLDFKLLQPRFLAKKKKLVRDLATNKQHGFKYGGRSFNGYLTRNSNFIYTWSEILPFNSMFGKWELIWIWTSVYPVLTLIYLINTEWLRNYSVKDYVSWSTNSIVVERTWLKVCQLKYFLPFIPEWWLMN